MKNTILCILFLNSVVCFCQKQVPIPLESIQVNLLLQKGPQDNVDSINWVRELSLCRQSDSFNFYPQYSEIIINSIQDVCGKEFYLLEDSLILEALKNKIDENCQSQAYQKEISLNDFKRHTEAIKLTPAPKIEDQIWHPESHLILNYHYNKQQPENTNKYIRLVNSISYDSSIEIIDGRSYSFPYIKGRDSIINVVCSLKNNDFKYHLYLALIEKFVQLPCNEDDLLSVSHPIEEIFTRSGDYSPLQQAIIRIAIGKAFNTIRKNSEYAFFNFRFAEYILINNRLDDFHEKIKPIIADFIAAKREERYLAYLRQTLQPFNWEPYNRESDKRNYIPITEFFKRVLRIAHYETVIAFTEIRGTGTLTNRRLLIVAGVLHSLSKYLNDSEIKKNETLIRDFNVLLCDYYRLVLQTEKADQVQRQLIVNTAKSANNLISLKYYEDLKKLADIKRDKGEITLAKNIYLITEQCVNEKMNYYHPYQDYTFSFPSDPRLWKPDHFQMLIDSVGPLDAFYYGGDQKFPVNENLEYNFGLKPDQLLKILGEWAIKQKDWQAAAMLLSKVDRARIKIDDEQSSRVFSAALFGLYVPEKYKSENTIRELYTYLIIGVLVVVLISGLTVWAIRERKKAKSEEAKSTILAQTMHQIAHLAPQCIDKIYEKQKSTTPDSEVLNNLSVTLRMFHDYSQKKKITYAEELTLVRSFINLAYAKETGQKPAIKIRSNVRDYPYVTLPTYILFNAVQNAFKHGFVGDMEGSYVDVSLSQNQYGYSMTITNEASEPKTEENKTKTGIVFMKKILRYWNNEKTDQLHYRFEDNKFILKFLFKENGKI